ncbi:MAG: putative bifunctional diguanylate cyclase/phosphodiesterase [Hyphomicrobium sp.]
MHAVFSMAGNLSVLREIASASREAFLVFDTSWRVTLCNAAASRLMGLHEHEVEGRLLWQIAPEIMPHEPFDAPPEGGMADGVGIERLPPLAGEPTGRHGRKWFVQPLLDETGQVVGGLCIHEGSGWSGEVERQLHASDRRFRDFAESASDWFWETDRNLCYSYVSERYQEATGLSPESRLGRRRGDFRLEGPDDGDWPSHLADLEARRSFRDFTFAYLDANGRRRVAKVSGRPVVDGNGEFVGYRGVGCDITSEVEAERRIRFLAQHDPLTSLPNRTLLTDRLQQALATARRTRRGLALLCVDLGDFKSVNDTLGHAAGDALLCETARRMREAVREMDTVARLGGDEFAVVQVESRGWEDAKALAQKLIANLSQPIEVAGEQIHCGASIGISFYPIDSAEADELIRNADLALYRAKAAGRNTFCCFLPEMNEEVRKRRAIEDHLRDALDRNLLTLHYQPQVDLSTGRMVGAEALLRWQHQERGLITPGSFMHIAERSGMILKIDRWVLREACSQAKTWREAGLLTERIAINLSAVQLARADLIKDLISVLEETGLPANQLAIEITESVLLTDTEAVPQTLAAVHDMGVELAVDDFGTGYSSLTYLRRFPVQKVKIDRSFVRNICTNLSDASIVRAIISLGHSLGLQVVAEGVEAKEQFDYLRNAGCDLAQGYYIAMPMSGPDFEVFLRYTVLKQPHVISIPDLVAW